VGFAVADGSPPAQVWRNAEMALARAKAAGAAQVEVFPPAGAGPGEHLGLPGASPRIPRPGAPEQRPLDTAGPGDEEAGGVAGGDGAQQDAGLGAEPGPVVSAVGEAAETPAGAGA
jgi:hypothetical protein